jgi:formyltetrahydrofolate-dependent phosphoribosylglycinamide formyltransferase
VKRRVAVLISGRGSNLASLDAACAGEAYPAEIVLVLSNRADAGGLKLASVTARSVIDHRPYGKDRIAHEQEIQKALEIHRVDLVCLAGYMRQLTPWLVERWRGRMLNIHPSLLPAFPGLHTHARALAAGVKLHGCTVHLVTEALDEGPIVAQASVPVLPDDNEERLAARVLAQEHLLYPAALALVAGQSPCWARPADALCNPLPLPSSRA